MEIFCYRGYYTYCSYTNSRQVAEIRGPSSAGDNPYQGRNVTTGAHKFGRHRRALNDTSLPYEFGFQRSTNGVILQADAPKHLKLVSQPKGVGLDDKALKGYYYDSAAGEETTVYVLDTGLDSSHPVSC